MKSLEMREAFWAKKRRRPWEVWSSGRKQAVEGRWEMMRRRSSGGIIVRVRSGCEVDLGEVAFGEVITVIDEVVVVVVVAVSVVVAEDVDIRIEFVEFALWCLDKFQVKKVEGK
jgi:hypothetical protein